MVMKKIHILLFGSKGQVGREIEELAKIKDIKITGFDVDSLDITEAGQVSAVFEKCVGVDFAINSAAYTNVDKAEEEPEKAYRVNCVGVQNLAFNCRKWDIPLFHISTDYVFSGEKAEPYIETDLPNPCGIYGKSKLAGDLILESIWHKHIILRVSWVFGKYGNNFVKTILRLAQEQNVINVVGDQFGYPTAAADIARVFLEIAGKVAGGQKKWGIYNYCNYPVTTWHEFAMKIVELGRNKLQLKVKQINKITTDEFPTKAKRPRNSELLVDKINKDYSVLRKDWDSYLSEVINALEL